ncbi:hypothetical protein GDO78_018670 [Eleutherodactylus coqui]|uniref:Uncharacterized protein n=1 Tax=Eleutherodactylus coqui TaxID=57060 RepID=A0A8J6BDH6_ELECQ|nr:hypothetical protein GDO78_018670 [Eleutherodactylus coqui]
MSDYCSSTRGFSCNHKLSVRQSAHSHVSFSQEGSQNIAINRVPDLSTLFHLSFFWHLSRPLSFHKGVASPVNSPQATGNFDHSIPG